MSLSVESKKKAEFLDVTLKVEFVFESNKHSRVMPIKIVLGDHEIEGDLIICRVSHLNLVMGRTMFTVQCSKSNLVNLVKGLLGSMFDRSKPKIGCSSSITNI